MGHFRRKRLLVAAAVSGLLCGRALAAAEVSPAQLAELSLEQLSNLEITSVSGRVENLKTAAASIYVITAQDIRRSGALTLPEALRLAPNLQVAQTSSGQWAISARGFQDLISNKLLVLVDGRTIYSPLFAGVFWDANEVVLEDIERIEVISGPGGTIWGANAVNGVINVVTRNAAETQGTLLSITRSNRGGRQVARWGTAMGDSGHLRAYALALDRRATQQPSGVDQHDASRLAQAGFRGDWSFGASNLTLQGDAYHGGDRPANSLAPLTHGGNLMGRWRSSFADGSAYTVQAIYDVADRDDVDLFRNRAATTEIQFSHEVQVPRGELLWGAGYRNYRDFNAGNAIVLFVPSARSLSWANVFAQYKWPVTPELDVTTGVKVERNSYSGVEPLPSVRLAWTPSEGVTAWAAVSRAVRAPARIDRDFFFPGTAPFLIAGGPNFQSEVANVYEVGHRAGLGRNLSWSATLFHDRYDGLRSGRPGQPPPNTVENLVQGSVDGLETWGAWQVTPDWRMTAGYLRLHERLRYCCGLSPSTTTFPGLGVDARSQWSLRSSHDLPGQVELDLMLRHTGALSPVVPSYTSLDLQLGKQLSAKLRVALIVRNAFNPRHVEYLSTGAGGAPDSEFHRLVMLRLLVEL